MDGGRRRYDPGLPTGPGKATEQVYLLGEHVELLIEQPRLLQRRPFEDHTCPTNILRSVWLLGCSSPAGWSRSSCRGVKTLPWRSRKIEPDSLVVSIAVENRGSGCTSVRVRP